MFMKLGTMTDMAKLPSGLDHKVIESIEEFVRVLDQEYGADRDVDEDDGGYVLLCSCEEDLPRVKACINYTIHPPEWVNIISTIPVYCAALFLTNNEYAITVIIPLAEAPEEIVREIDEFS